MTEPHVSGRQYLCLQCTSATLNHDDTPDPVIYVENMPPRVMVTRRLFLVRKRSVLDPAKLGACDACHLQPATHEVEER